MLRTRSRIWAFLLVLLLSGRALPVFAQEEDAPEEEEPGAPPIVSDWDSYIPDLYSLGDRTFNISLGVLIPTVFAGKGLEGNPHNLGLGGTGSLTFNFFLNSHFFLGGELAGAFVSTKGENMLFIVPFGIRAGWQFVVSRFEFPFTLMIGAAPQKYLDKGYFGLIIKPGASAFYRFSSDWSFGLNANWWIVPEWPANHKDVVGNFVELTLSARYHF
jgi:hypothetical protein